MMRLNINKDNEISLNEVSNKNMILFFLSYFLVVYIFNYILGFFKISYIHLEYIPTVVRAISLIIVSIVFTSIRKEIITTFDFYVFGFKKIYIFLCLGFFLILAGEKIIFENAIFIDDRYRVMYENNISHSYSHSLIWVIISIAIVPLFEEIFYRVLLFGWLNAKFGVYLAVIVSSIVFGIIHVDYPAFGVILGVIFSLLYKYSGSILPSLLLHIVWNTFIFLRA